MSARPENELTPIVSICGPSGSGKTSLLVRLIPELRRRGLVVAAIKHTQHNHALDRPGKDSDRLRQAGAVAVALQSPDGFALVGPPVTDPRDLARLFPAVDLILCEGARTFSLPKIEVHRSIIDPRFLCAEDPDVIAVVSDKRPPLDLPRFSPEATGALAEFLTARLGIAAPDPSTVPHLPKGECHPCA